MDGAFLIDDPNSSDGTPEPVGAPSTMVDKQVASAAQMAVVVQSQPSVQDMANAHHHHHHQPEHNHTHGAAPECTGDGDGKGPLLVFVPGLILMILGTALIKTGAVYPLTITGGSVILAALFWQSIYRSCLGSDCPGPVGQRGACARLVGHALSTYCYVAWLFLAVTTPDDPYWAAVPTIVLWPVAFCLLHWESEQCRRAKLKAWLDRRPIQINRASAAQLAAAAQAKGEPYFTASFVQRLEEKQVNGEVLDALLKAEQTQGPDSTNASAFFDEMLEGLSIHHKIAAKQILRQWVECGVPAQPQLMEPAVLGTVVSQ